MLKGFWHSPDDGFSLLEVLVALSIFSIAALALINAQTNSARTAGHLQERAIAAMVAETILNEALIGTVAPTLGVYSGVEDMAGRSWQWQVQVAPLSRTDLLRLEVGIRAPDGDQLLYSLIGFRGTP